jgi:hypothetical protein
VIRARRRGPQQRVIVWNAHGLDAFRDMKAIGVMSSAGRGFPVNAVLATDRQNDVAGLLDGRRMMRG